MDYVCEQTYRSLGYQSMLSDLSVSGPMHMEYLLENGDERKGMMESIKRMRGEIASANMRDADKEYLFEKADAQLGMLRKGVYGTEGSGKAAHGQHGGGATFAQGFIAGVIAKYLFSAGMDMLGKKVDEMTRENIDCVMEELRSERPGQLGLQQELMSELSALVKEQAGMYEIIEKLAERYAKSAGEGDEQRKCEEGAADDSLRGA